MALQYLACLQNIAGMLLQIHSQYIACIASYQWEILR